MDAIIKQSSSVGLKLVQLPQPSIGIDDVLIQIKETAISGIDLDIYTWNHWSQKNINPPVVIGHEFIGVIKELGSNVKGLKVGDRVSAESHISCGTCRRCLSGKKHLCSNTLSIGIHRDGVFAEYVSIPAANVWLADPKIPDEIMACFNPLGYAVHAATFTNLLGSDILITGAGPIGCMATAIAKKAGARNIVVTDVNEYRLEIARHMGATLAVDDRAINLFEVMKELGIKEGFSIGFEMSGSPVAFNKMIDCMMHGGRLLLIGMLPDKTPIDWSKMISKSLLLKGIQGRKFFETWYHSTNLIRGGVDIMPIITHKFHYKDFEKAFQLMHAGECGKIILNWGKEDNKLPYYSTYRKPGK